MHCKRLIRNNTLLIIVLASYFQLLITGCTKEVLSSNVATIEPVKVVVLVVTPPATNTVTVASGNGIDKTSEIQTAVNSGKPVVLQKGIYRITKPIIKTSGTLTLTGDNATILLDPSFPKTGAYTAAFTFSNLTALTMTGITIDGNRAQLNNAGVNWTNYIMALQLTGSSNINIANCNSINSPSISFNLADCKNVKIENCTSVNAMYHGISLQYCSNVTVSNSKVIGIGNQGNDLNKGGIGILGTGGDNLTFTNNYIEDMSDTGTKTEGTNTVTWANNTVKNSGKDGIKFQNLVGADQVHGNRPQIQTVSNGKIINNIIDKIFNGRNDGSALIQIMGAENVTVNANTITGGSKKGQEDGISVVTNTTVSPKRISIVNNKITNTSRFIYLSNTTQVAITNNICTNLIAPLAAYNGFTAENSKNIGVKNNTFQRSNTGTIDGFAASFYDCSAFSLMNNKLLNANSALSARLITADADTIANNIMDNFGSYAISIYTGKVGTVVNKLLMTNNSITKMGMRGGLGWMFKIDPTNMTINTLDLTSSKVVGNGNNGDWAIAIKGAQTIKNLILTNFYSDGNAAYPSLAAISAAINIVGWKSPVKPLLGYWPAGSIVLNLNLLSPILGWKCVTAGSPGVWVDIKR